MTVVLPASDGSEENDQGSWRRDTPLMAENRNNAAPAPTQKLQSTFRKLRRQI